LAKNEEGVKNQLAKCGFLFIIRVYIQYYYEKTDFVEILSTKRRKLMKKHLSRKKFLFVSLIVLTLPATEAFAGARDHEGGFFLRLSAGAGYAQTEFGDPATMKYFGSCGDFNFAVGGIVLRNFAVHGSLLVWPILDPTVEAGGDSEKLSGSLTLSAVGVGITYYIMPINIYISPSAGIGRLTLELGGSTGDTEMGPIFDFTLGKEWWVGGSWGLGVAGTVGYHSVPESENIDVNWEGYSIGVRFSATLN
jgi:hypothetical protein